LFSICEWGEDDPWTWGDGVGNMWRVGPDHLPFWWLPDDPQGTVDIIANMAGKSKFAGPGGWNDPDFLMTGAITMSYIDSLSEFSFWALFAAPLIVTTDIRDMSNKGSILLNAEVVAVNQDKMGVAGDFVANFSDGGQVWSKPLSGGNFAVILFNPNFLEYIDVTILWSQLWPTIPQGKQCSVRDLWAHEDLGLFADNFTASVGPHGVSMVTVTPASLFNSHGQPDEIYYSKEK